MAVIQRITDFIPNTLIVSQEVDDEFNQLVNLLSGVSTNKDALVKYSHATDPVLRVDQLGAGVVQQWLQNGTVKSRINNNGSLESIAGPVIAASQLIAAPLTIDGTTDILLKANGHIVGYAKCIQSSFANPIAGNVGAGLDTLFSGSIPAATLTGNGDFSEVIFDGNLASNDNDKRIQLTIGGTVFLNTALVDIDAFAWRIVVHIGRISATSVMVNTTTQAGQLAVTSAGTPSGSGIYVSTTNAVLTVSDLGSNAIALLLEAEATTTNDVTLTELIMSACQMT